MKLLLTAACVAAFACSAAYAGSSPDAPAAAPLTTATSVTDWTDRLIVRLREPVAADAASKASAVAASGGLRFLRAMSGNSHVLQLPRMMSRAEAEAVARRLAADPTVASAEVDGRRVPMRTPNDSLYPQQWHYFEAAGGINLPAAWDRTTGSAAITVAVIDTGYRDHVDLTGRFVAGYDFITDLTFAQDGNGRDADAHDPGDYGCNGNNSSWHGTHVAGTIGAATDNGTGVAGINWVSKIQPLRVLGRCGGYDSDIIDAMRWASGIAVPGVPTNATPARVLNLSLGGAGVCSTALQNAVNDVIARGSVIVVAAGNDNANASGYSPASCSGVISVAATTRTGGRASYSNFGTSVTIAAPGGGNGNYILSTLNAGLTTPGADNYVFYQGTSMAAPHVAGTVSLMLSANPALTPAQVKTALQSSARTFPTGTGDDCTPTRCGAGILDAAAALAATSPVTPPPAARVNLALAANGAVLSASSTYNANYPVSGANNGERAGSNWAAGGGWNDATVGSYPDWLQVDFPSATTVSEVDVYTVQDDYNNPTTPTDTLTFTQYGITDFEIQSWNGTAWVTVPGGSVTGNNKVWRKFTFPAISTTKLRVLVLASLGSYSRITEIEAYATADTSVNVASQANGGVAVASGSYSANYPVNALNDGDRRGRNWGAGGGWNDATIDSWPDIAQVNFAAAKTITEIDVFTIQDNYPSPVEPTETMLFNTYGITAFDVQTWNGSTWVTVPGGSVTGNNKVWRRFTFPAITTVAVRVVVNASLASYSRITEIEAWGAP
jgi:serine protease